MAVPITALYGAINGVFNVALAVGVTLARGRSKVFLGTGESPELLLAARRHGNNAEYVALALVVMLLAELSGGAPAVIHGAGAALTAGRLAHAMGVGSAPSPLRAIGAVLTWGAIVTAAVYALVVSMHA